MFKVEIDFDEASREWRRNKIELDYGQFRYCCSQLTKKGEKCRNKIVQNDLCHLHFKSKK
jgi:hypothetical protein